MVLVRYGIVAAFVLLMSACTNIQQKGVVAVNSGVTGEMSSVSGRANSAPTPKAAFNLLERADSASKQSNWTQAMRYLDQAQRMAPEEAKVYLKYGEIYMRQGKNEQAVAMFKRVLSLVGESGDIGEEALEYLHQLQAHNGY